MIDISLSDEEPIKQEDEPKDPVKQLADTEMNMSVSPVCTDEQGKNYAFVTFTEGSRSAEGKIPDCEIIRNEGFSKEEVEGLKEYMKENIGKLKRMAASVNVMDAFLKK